MGSYTVKAVYFDMGGVLMDVSGDYSREAAIRYGLSGPAVREFLGDSFDTEAFIQSTNDAIELRLNAQGYLQEDAYRQDRLDMERLLKKSVPFDVFQEKFWRQIEFMTGCFILRSSVLPTLRSLRERGFLIGLISNVFHPAIIYKEMFTKWGIIEFFNPLLFSSEFRFKKPHRAIFEYALTWHPGLSAEEVVFVGDTWDIDVIGSRAAGYRPIWINSKYTDKECDGIPVIADIAEIVELLDR